MSGVTQLNGSSPKIRGTGYARPPYFRHLFENCVSSIITTWRHRMRERIKFWLASLLVLSLFLSACTFGQEPEPTPDVGVIFTAAAETVQAQFALQLTQTALAAPTATLPPPPLPPTATLIPTFAIDGSNNAPATTPLATLGVGTQSSILPGLASPTPLAALATEAEQCNNSAFIQDVTYPDGTEVKAEERILKVWRIQNTGTCTWDRGYVLVQYSGDNMNASKWQIIYKKEYIEPEEIVDISVEVTVPSTAGDHGGCWRLQGTDGYYFGTPMCMLIKVK
jgi:hypothetical protein